MDTMIFVAVILVTVQICGDLGTIRPLVEGQPSTEFPLQTVSVPSNVNSYLFCHIGGLRQTRQARLGAVPIGVRLGSGQPHPKREHETCYRYQCKQG